MRFQGVKKRILYRPDKGFYWLLEWMSGKNYLFWHRIESVDIVGKRHSAWVGPYSTLDDAFKRKF